MKINIKATGIELTPAISNYVNKKISSIEKYIDKKNVQATVAQVEVGKNTRHHKTGNVFRAEVHITGAGLDLYAVSEMDDLYAAIDIVKDEIIHSLVQVKGKKETLTRRGAKIIKNMLKGLASFRKRTWIIGDKEQPLGFLSRCL